VTYGARAQVPRMLAMVPYLRGRAEVPVDQVARDFGVSRAQVVKDLGVLWFCGLPEAVTGEMIDVDMDALDRDGVVRIDNAEFLPRPLRLTVAEALSPIVPPRTPRGGRGRPPPRAAAPARATPDSLPRPLRLTVAEALSLIVALRTLREATGSRER